MRAAGRMVALKGDGLPAAAGSKMVKGAAVRPAMVQERVHELPQVGNFNNCDGAGSAILG